MTGEVRCRIPRCGGGTASLGVGTLALSIKDGKGTRGTKTNRRQLSAVLASVRTAGASAWLLSVVARHKPRSTIRTQEAVLDIESAKGSSGHDLGRRSHRGRHNVR